MLFICDQRTGINTEPNSHFLVLFSRTPDQYKSENGTRRQKVDFIQKWTLGRESVSTCVLRMGNKGRNSVNVPVA